MSGRRSNEELADDVRRALSYAASAYAVDQVQAAVERAKISLAILVDRAEGVEEKSPHHKTIEEVEQEVIDIGRRTIRM